MPEILHHQYFCLVVLSREAEAGQARLQLLQRFPNSRWAEVNWSLGGDARPGS